MINEIKLHWLERLKIKIKMFFRVRKDKKYQYELNKFVSELNDEMYKITRVKK